MPMYIVQTVAMYRTLKKKLSQLINSYTDKAACSDSYENAEEDDDIEDDVPRHVRNYRRYVHRNWNKLYVHVVYCTGYMLVDDA